MKNRCEAERPQTVGSIRPRHLRAVCLAKGMERGARRRTLRSYWGWKVCSTSAPGAASGSRHWSTMNRER